MTEPKQGFIHYIKAANATGGGSMFAFVMGIAMAYFLGYYTHYNKLKSKNSEVVIQAINNDDLDKDAKNKQSKDLDYLNRSLLYIGYSKDDIEDLIGYKPNKLDKLKGKFTTFIKGKTVYLPRSDCDDDYLGERSANEANEIILDGFNRRYKSND